MEKQKVDQFMMMNAKFFPPMMVGQIKEKLATLDEEKGITCKSVWIKHRFS